MSCTWNTDLGLVQPMVNHDKTEKGLGNVSLVDAFAFIAWRDGGSQFSMAPGHQSSGPSC